MKAYAVHMDGFYFLAYAPTADKAKGMVIERFRLSVGQYRMGKAIHSLRCRRWKGLDETADERARIEPWGIPGTRDWETGTYIAMPDPFQEERL